VSIQRILQLVGKSEEIHHQPARFVLEHEVHPRNGMSGIVARSDSIR
jgi:hypothetical protein